MKVHFRFAVLLAIGCGAPPDGPAEVATALADEFGDYGDRVGFWSWDGHVLHEGDSTEVTLFKDGTCAVVYIGDNQTLADSDFAEGTYLVDKSNVTLTFDKSAFPNMPGANDWPDLKMQWNNGKLSLFPVRETTTLNYDGTSAWPLSQQRVGE